jgi:hypothetical protein
MSKLEILAEAIENYDALVASHHEQFEFDDSCKEVACLASEIMPILIAVVRAAENLVYEGKWADVESFVALKDTVVALDADSEDK